MDDSFDLMILGLYPTSAGVVNPPPSLDMADCLIGHVLQSLMEQVL